MWTSPNMEFATVFVGAIAVLVFGLSFWSAVAAILLGNALGALFHGVLTTWGPQTGLGQMALGRKAFGFWGNLLPAGFRRRPAGGAGRVPGADGRLRRRCGPRAAQDRRRRRAPGRPRRVLDR